MSNQTTSMDDIHVQMEQLSAEFNAAMERVKQRAGEYSNSGKAMDVKELLEVVNAMERKMKAVQEQYEMMMANMARDTDAVRPADVMDWSKSVVALAKDMADVNKVVSTVRIQRQLDRVDGIDKSTYAEVVKRHTVRPALPDDASAATKYRAASPLQMQSRIQSDIAKMTTAEPPNQVTHTVHRDHVTKTTQAMATQGFRLVDHTVDEFNRHNLTFEEANK